MTEIQRAEQDAVEGEFTPHDGMKNLRSYIVASRKSLRLLILPAAWGDCFAFLPSEIPIGGWFAQVPIAYADAVDLGPVVPFVEDDLTWLSMPLQLVTSCRWTRQQIIKATGYALHFDPADVTTQIEYADEFQSVKLAAILRTITRQFRSVWEAHLTEGTTIKTFADALAEQAITEYSLGIEAGVPEDEYEEHFWEDWPKWKIALVILFALIMGYVWIQFLLSMVVT